MDHHTYLAFTWVLGIWILVFTFVQQMNYSLSHTPLSDIILLNVLTVHEVTLCMLI